MQRVDARPNQPVESLPKALLTHRADRPSAGALRFVAQGKQETTHEWMRIADSSVASAFSPLKFAPRGGAGSAREDLRIVDGGAGFRRCCERSIRRC
jgi:hypothetical protein